MTQYGSTTLDGFLDGRITVEQPKVGYRAATDPVYLAATIPAKSGQTVFDVGCGVGVASLCLGVRCNVEITGLEIQKNYADLAEHNAKSNEVDLKVINGDLADLPPLLKRQEFDHVITNPPFFEVGTLSAPQNADKSMAHIETLDLATWIQLCLKRLKPLGTFTIIQRADRLPDILTAVGAGCGDIKILPIASRSGQDAKRVLVQATKTSKGPLKLLAPFIVHVGAKHSDNANDYSDRASNVLRCGHALDIGS